MSAPRAAEETRYVTLAELKLLESELHRKREFMMSQMKESMHSMEKELLGGIHKLEKSNQRLAGVMVGAQILFGVIVFLMNNGFLLKG